ncbi:preprotein translocase subunit YajC [Hymenobacter aerilatus]|uniref:Sec translocon accessory complex subunit YajC n=1 Tax=Hymenobacter aerilatus TaxID=2932251 RepID=A0A8T9SSJ9_9BACT|nr:preprotein translocase subunit YajC [Hymenobacter aerilatus]UOR04785.1 preprotein translocase subunit YajC [Hymenobacter aerilatus]
MLLTLLLQAPAGGGMTQFLLLGAMFVVLYFFMIRPQQKRAKEAKVLRDSLTKGANVVTIGGLHGKIVDVAENSVVIEVDKGTRLTFDRTAIARQI